MREAVILSAVRLPTGRFLGALKGMTAPQLGALVVKEAARRAGVAPEQVDEVILGNVVSAGLGQAPARQAALHAGLPPSVAALTINKVCGSGLKAVMLAAQAVQTDNAEIVVAGGMESMSNCPYLLPKAREGMRLGHGQLLDSMIGDGLWDAFEDYHMGCTGEIVAEKYGVTRAEQDAYALLSHQKAVAAIKAGKFKDEILPVPLPQKKGDPVLFADDEKPARGHLARGPLAAQARLQGGRHRDRRERARGERRGRRPGGDLGRARAGAGAKAPGPDRRPGGGRPAARARDDDSGGGGAEALEEDRLDGPGRRSRWS